MVQTLIFRGKVFVRAVTFAERVCQRITDISLSPIFFPFFSIFRMTAPVVDILRCAKFQLGLERESDVDSMKGGSTPFVMVGTDLSRGLFRALSHR